MKHNLIKKSFDKKKAFWRILFYIFDFFLAAFSAARFTSCLRTSVIYATYMSYFQGWYRKCPAIVELPLALAHGVAL